MLQNELDRLEKIARIKQNKDKVKVEYDKKGNILFKVLEGNKWITKQEIKK